MDQHDIGRFGGKRLQPAPHRLLARCAARNRRREFQIADRVRIKRLMLAADNHTHPRDRRVQTKGINCVTKYGSSAKILILLRKITTMPAARPGGYDQCHRHLTPPEKCCSAVQYAQHLPMK